MMPWLQNPNANKPGLGQQVASSAASKIAADQVAKLGLQAAGTAAAGPLGGAVAGAAGDLAGPLASQLVGSLFNKGGSVYMDNGGIAGWQEGNTIHAGAPASFLSQFSPAEVAALQQHSAQARAREAARNNPALAAFLGGANNQELAEVYEPTHDVEVKGNELNAKKKAVKKKAAPLAQPVYDAPRSKASAKWDIPLGEALGAEWSTSGSYADMDRGSDPWSAMLKGTWRFEEGGSVWDKVKSAAKHAWKNDNLAKKEGRWKNAKPQYKAIGGMTPGPLGMSDMLVAGKDKDISKVKLKKSKGDMSEEMEYSYHPPLAAKPKPTGE